MITPNPTSFASPGTNIPLITFAIITTASKNSPSDIPFKTSTGFNTSGATTSDVKLLRNVVGPNFGVKASGGIRTYDDALKMIKAGANRLGTSSGVAIISEII